MQEQGKSVEAMIRDFRAGTDRERNFHLLFTRLHGQVCGFFERKGMSLDDSQDLAQDVFFQLFKKLDTLQDETRFPGWVLAICRNTFNNEIERRRAQKRFSPAAACVSTAGDNPEIESIASANPAANSLKTVLDKEKIHAFWVAIQRLPEQMRRCIYLRVSHECSDEEIATLLGVSCSTVRVHLHRARKSLAEALRPVFGDLQI
jgi:RNA polymerase sigma-70 factor, ECF subfamily